MNKNKLIQSGRIIFLSIFGILTGIPDVIVLTGETFEWFALLIDFQ